MAVYEKASGEYPMNAGFYGAPGIAVAPDLTVRIAVEIVTELLRLALVQSDGNR